MTILQAIILGIVQGLTEFLPISSSGHLIIVPWALGWTFFIDHPDLNKTFDVALHLGTFFAVLAFFWRDVVRLLGAFFRSLARRRVETPQERLAWLLLISTIPAGLVGVALESFIEDSLGKPLLIAILMIAFGVVMWVVDMRTPQARSIDGLRRLDALLIGVAQAVALAPGVSRSGITMITARALSVDVPDVHPRHRGGRPLQDARGRTDGPSLRHGGAVLLGHDQRGGVRIRGRVVHARLLAQPRLPRVCALPFRPRRGDHRSGHRRAARRRSHLTAGVRPTGAYVFNARRGDEVDHRCAKD
jgi:undecaprenyl-diphosphatase UppP